jgi:hypothetical protein
MRTKPRNRWEASDPKEGVHPQPVYRKLDTRLAPIWVWDNPNLANKLVHLLNRSEHEVTLNMFLTAMDVLRQISSVKRNSLERRLSRSAIAFIESLRE